MCFRRSFFDAKNKWRKDKIFLSLRFVHICAEPLKYLYLWCGKKGLTDERELIGPNRSMEGDKN